MNKEWIDIIEVFANLATITGLVFIYFQFRRNIKVEKSRFWLELRVSFRNHKKVHEYLEENGIWSEKKSGPSSNKDWVKVYAYLGQFELCKIMLDQKLIDRKTFESQYKYRIENILRNKVIVNKIIEDKEYWKNFILLCNSLKDIYNPLGLISLRKKKFKLFNRI